MTLYFSTSLRGALATWQSTFFLYVAKMDCRAIARNDSVERLTSKCALLSALMLSLVTPAFAQQTSNPSNADIAAQLQKLTGKNSQEALGQVVVIGSLLGCTQKAAGKEETNRFYHRMKAIGDQAEGYCRAGQAKEARALLLGAFEQYQTAPVLQAALGCYDAQKQTVDAIGGRKMAADVANYARWVRDPKLAQAEMKEADVCRRKVARSPSPVARGSHEGL